MSANPKASWPAFPVAEDHKIASDFDWSAGITIRDYFAAKAMDAMIRETFIGPIEKLARRSYEIADAMLEERNKATKQP